MASAGEMEKDPVDDTDNDDQRLEQEADHGATPDTSEVTINPKHDTRRLDELERMMHELLKYVKPPVTTVELTPMLNTVATSTATTHMPNLLTPPPVPDVRPRTTIRPAITTSVATTATNLAMSSSATGVTRPVTTMTSGTPRVAVRPLVWHHTFGKKDSDDIDGYNYRFERYANGCQWDDPVKGPSFLSTLEGRAACVVRDLPTNANWSGTVRFLRERWEPEQRRRTLRENFTFTTRKSSETAEEFLLRLTSLALRAFGHYPADLRNEMVLNTYLSGQPDYIKNKLVATQYTNVDDI